MTILLDVAFDSNKYLGVKKEKEKKEGQTELSDFFF